MDVIWPKIPTELLAKSETQFFDRLSATPVTFARDARGAVTRLIIRYRGKTYAYDRVSDEPRTTAKADRLHLSETDIACSGQAWGAESEDCLMVIARQSGKSVTRPIRLIAAAEPDLGTPNVF